MYAYYTKKHQTKQVKKNDMTSIPFLGDLERMHRTVVITLQQKYLKTEFNFRTNLVNNMSKYSLTGIQICTEEIINIIKKNIYSIIK